MSQQFVQAVAERAAHLVDHIIPGGEGACLGASAIVARVLADHDIASVAVGGSYDEHDHWWLEVDGLRVDVTRAQFDCRPIVEPINDDADECPYLTERSFPARWDHEQAVAEFTRMFAYTDVGAAHGRIVLTALRKFAREEIQP